MKTSNKILLSGVGFLLLLLVSSLLYGKRFITNADSNKVVGSGQITERILDTELRFDSIYIDDHFNYILDPESEAVIITGEKEIIEIMKQVNNHGLDIQMGTYNHISYSLPLTVIIGVKNRDSLYLRLSGSAILKSSAPMNIGYLSIDAKHQAKINLENNGELLSITCKGHATVNVSGKMNQSQIVLKDSGEVEVNKMDCDNVELKMEDFTSLFLNSSNNVTGKMEDNAILQSETEIKTTHVTFYDNSKYRVKSWD